MEDCDDDQTDLILHWVHWFIPIRFLQKLNVLLNLTEHAQTPPIHDDVSSGA